MTNEEKKLAFGDMLTRGLRETEMSDIALAQATRINLSFIQALCAGKFEELPGEVFGRGFVKSICKVMAVDETEYLEAYNSCWESGGARKNLKAPGNDKILESKVGLNKKGSSKKTNYSSFFSTYAVLKIGVPAAAVIAVIGLFFVIRPIWQKASEIGDKKEAVVESDTQSLPVVSEEAVSVQPATAAPVAVEPAAVEQANTEKVEEVKNVEVVAPTAGDLQTLVVVVSSQVKIRSRFDGGNRDVQKLAPDTYRYSFKETAELLIFDASVVDISFNGRNLGKLGEQGRVRRLSFSALSSDKKL